MKILLIEDEQKTVQSLKQGLEENGFEVEFCYDGLMGKHLAKKKQFQLIVSDVIMPGLNGIELCRELRNEGVQTPILLLTALGELEDKLLGFEVGADDYLIKPFEFQELLARIKAMSRRMQGVQMGGNLLRFADLTLDLDAKTVFRSEKKIELTAKEFALLEYLLRNQGKVLSKDDIAEKVWDYESSTNLIEVYITLLRKKIDKDFPTRLIHNVYGMGYVLKSE
ncbi:two-component system, OmpR family, copper resistance phosphate regulon response regulator CusR [Pseudarcicella hirudinis]|uniref:Two-component system, OmpR family, copper resistance phosphate regulon response regulator CusR n=1 Tax=Pseudarcicella hirudinis TaxID=1079859 RepID=A0A1I5P785_9BACT|nr:response regulator transcription factor [Pseudarcicella hirudinis]SFP29968.1 two-component system, OmpR family, copper resistance phosphate regulon response regulator CusR [Pseudarcicella hirudinis]